MPLTPASGPPEPPRELIPADLLPLPFPTPPDRTPPDAGRSDAGRSEAGRSGAGRSGAGRRGTVRAAVASRQLPMFGAESVDASPGDVAGLLAGPGRLHRMGGTARVSVRVDAAWRVHALVAEFAVRGLEAGWRPAGHRPADDSADTTSDAPAPDGDVPEDPVVPVVPVQADRPAQIDGDFLDDLGDGHPDDEPAGPVVGGGPRAAESGAAEGGAAEEGATEEGAAGEKEGAVFESGVRHSGSGAGGVAVFEVRTAYSSLLAPLARTWLDGTAKRVPRGFFLTGPRLRLWAVAAGSPRAGGYDLGLGEEDDDRARAAVVAALVQAGLRGETVQVTEGGPVYRISGTRRLARLAELVGQRPAAVPADRWPQT